MEEVNQEISQFIEEGRDLVNNGQGEKAVALYAEAAQFAREIGERKWEGYFYQQQGVAYKITSQYDLAIDSVTKAESIFTDLSDFFNVGCAQRDLGLIKLAEKKYDEAVEWLNISLDTLLTHTSDFNSAGITEAKLGLAYLELGKFTKAREAFQCGLTKILTQGDWFMGMTALLDFARLEYAEKNYDQMLTKLWAAVGLIYDQGQQDKQLRRLEEIYTLLVKGYRQTGAEMVALALEVKQKDYEARMKNS